MIYFSNDKLNYEIISDVIQPIALPSKADLYQDFVDEIALASGFGINADGDFHCFFV
jgi:hypothetical protein